jgi:hypothetical protein
MGTAATGPALFVATDLDSFETDRPEILAEDVTISGRCYRRLDPPYYAWLRRKVALAKKALDAGRLAAAVFELLRAAFNAVHAWAVKHLGEAALVSAARTFDPVRYVPPKADDDDLAGSRCVAPRDPSSPLGHRFPAQAAWPLTEPVTADAVAKVDAIRDRALALGWPEDALYRNRGELRFPYGGEYGLVCFVGGDARIGEVTRETITIERARGPATSFPNPDVSQPWRHAVALAGVA